MYPWQKDKITYFCIEHAPMKKKIFVILSVFITTTLFAQQYTSKSKKAIAYFDEGQKQMEMQQFSAATDIFRKAVAADTMFVEAYIMLAEAYLEQGLDTQALGYLKKSVLINPNYRILSYLELASTAVNTGNYKDGLWAAEKFLEKNTAPGKNLFKAKLLKEKCIFSLEAVKHPVPFKPVRLSDNVNAEFDDYWPSLSADEKTLVFTRLIPVNPTRPISVFNRQEDFYYSLKKDSAWEKAQPLGPPINTTANEGAQSISIDGKRVYFTACGRPESQGRCDLYFSMMINDKWIPPVNVGKPVNGPYHDKQPSISSEGRALYFASDRPGGYGGYDLWVSTLDSANKWREPRNLGANVNSMFNEQSPFIHFDSKTLYYSSDGWPGLGAMDIYVTKKTGDTTWSPCENIGYPINSCKDEIGLIVNATGNMAYFSSDRPGSQRKDIYEFELYKKAQTIMVTYMKGKVVDSIIRKPVAARFELIDLDNAEIVNQSKAGQNGEFLVCIPTDRDYALNVSSKGYLFYSGNITLSGVHDKSKPFLVDVALQPIQAGTRIILKNIFFEVNSFELKNTSIAELTKLKEFMINNPTLKIEVSGHTDNTGTQEYNLKLSENRAKSVVDYLTKNGIPAEHLIYKGYGSKVPIADNATEEGKAQNRRTEMKIIE